MHGKKETNKTAVRKSEGKRQLGRYRHRWENNIKKDHRKQGMKMWN